MTVFPPLVLASASPRRRECLDMLGLTYTVHPAHMEEHGRPGESAVEHVERLAREKAEAVAARFPEAELFYLIGADHVPTLPEWREAAALADAATFVVVPRSDGSGEGAGKLETGVAEFPPSFRGTVLRGEPTAISASDLRNRLRAGKSIENFVPPQVAAALKVRHSY